MKFTGQTGAARVGRQIWHYLGYRARIPLGAGMPGGHVRSMAVTYNYLFRRRKFAMEAEQINQIANSLADLAGRTAELRRYL
jgi:hypothetical protein